MQLLEEPEHLARKTHVLKFRRILFRVKRSDRRTSRQNFNVHPNFLPAGGQSGSGGVSNRRIERANLVKHRNYLWFEPSLLQLAFAEGNRPMDKLPTEVLYYPNFDPTQLAGIKQSLLLYDKVHLIATHVLAAVNFLARIVTRRVFSHARTSSS